MTWNIGFQSQIHYTGARENARMHSIWVVRSEGKPLHTHYYTSLPGLFFPAFISPFPPFFSEFRLAEGQRGGVGEDWERECKSEGRISLKD